MLCRRQNTRNWIKNEKNCLMRNDDVAAQLCTKVKLTKATRARVLHLTFHSQESWSRQGPYCCRPVRMGKVGQQQVWQRLEIFNWRTQRRASRGRRVFQVENLTLEWNCRELSTAWHFFLFAKLTALTNCALLQYTSGRAGKHLSPWIRLAVADNFQIVTVIYNPCAIFNCVRTYSTVLT